MTVTRFDIFGPEFEAAEDAGGEWVQYVDHAAALTAANARADAAEAKLAEVQLIAGVALHAKKQLEADLTAATARADAAEAKLKAILEADALIWAADAADMVRQIPKEPTE